MHRIQKIKDRITCNQCNASQPVHPSTPYVRFAFIGCYRVSALKTEEESEREQQISQCIN
ncbi:hypothetical protein DL95DRAFT_381802 [Leptodontidium sp. 2 PMI_412]|nr:hypothetical protein DL95DRAFT_381802 [Leptodontidium sp. 2 PMI_412]